MELKNSVSIAGYDNDNEGRVYDLAVLFAIKYFNLPSNTMISVELDELADGLNGYVIENQEDSMFFEIVVEKRNRVIQQIIMTIFHEMTHVKQHMFELLGVFLDDENKPPYMERWWEIEAFSESAKMVDAFTKFLTKHKDVPLYELYKHI